MAVQVQLRRGTAAAWTTADPLLAQGEMGLEYDTGRFKVGNGTSTWTLLPYSSGAVELADFLEMDNVSVSAPADGAVLVYQSSINKWIATTNLNQQNMDAGEF